MVYHVSCSVCDLEETMETVAEILDRQAEHRARYSERHVLEFEAEQ